MSNNDKLNKLIINIFFTVVIVLFLIGKSVKIANAVIIHNTWCGADIEIIVDLGGIIIDPITQVWAFPDDTSGNIFLDDSYTPYWTTPLGSGDWDYKFVTTGPNSEYYPNGGVEFYTRVCTGNLDTNIDNLKAIY